MRIATLQKFLHLLQKYLDESLLKKQRVQQELKQLGDVIAKLQEELQTESNTLASRLCDMPMYDFYSFYICNKQKQDILKIEVQNKEQELQHILEHVRSLYIEQKKYEHLLKKYQSLTEKNAQKAERKALDERAIQKAQQHRGRTSPS
ncbi:conserved hypothetical protein [Alphaproteobacteria bacterium]